MIFSTVTAFPSSIAFSFLIALVPAAINLALAIYIYTNMPRRVYSTLFCINLIFIVFWQLGSGLVRISPDAASAHIFAAIFEPFGLLCAAVLLHFSVLLTRHEKASGYRGLLFICYVLSFFAALAYPVFLTDADFSYVLHWGWVNERPHFMYNLFAVPVQFQYFISIWLLTRGVFTARKRSNRYYQFLLIDLSLIAIIILAFFNEAVIPLIFKLHPLSITSFTLLIFTIAVFISLKKFRLFTGFEAINKEDLLASVSDYVIVVNQELEVAYINDPGLKQIGKGMNELEGRPISDILSLSEDNEDFLDIIVSSSVSGSNIRNFKFYMISASGEKTPVLVSSDVLKNHNEAEGILLVCRNITDLETAQAEARRHLAHYKQLFEASPFAIVSLNTEGKIQTVNKAFEKTFQYALDEVKDGFLEKFIAPGNALPIISGIYDELRQGRIVSYTTLRQKKDKTQIDVFATCFPVIADRKVIGIYIMYIDITTQRQQEKDMAKKNEQLQKINAELDRFVYSASHDIRSPLMTILGLVNIGENELKDHNGENTLKYFGMIRESVLKLDSFTMDIIRYSNNLRSDIKPDSFAFMELADEIISLFKNQEACKEIRFYKEADGDIMVTTDKQRLYVVLYQLVANAVRFRNPSGAGPYVKISARISAENNLEFEVADNGEGIDKEFIPRIFEMFTRFSLQTKGAGLGLYMVQEIISRLNGSITVDSRPAEGSVFRVIVPLVP